MRNILILFVIIAVLLLGIYFIKNQKTDENPVPVGNIEQNDPVAVEKYIRENIKILAPEEPVLGGTWYVTMVEINKESKTGTMSYEDGHIAGSARFSYHFEMDRVIIENIIKK